MTPPWLVAKRRQIDGWDAADDELTYLARYELPPLLTLIEALGEALSEAQAIMGSEELAGTIAHVHGFRYTETFRARCLAAHETRTAALARYQRGPEA